MTFTKHQKIMLLRHLTRAESAYQATLTRDGKNDVVEAALEECREIIHMVEAAKTSG